MTGTVVKEGSDPPNSILFIVKDDGSDLYSLIAMGSFPADFFHDGDRLEYLIDTKGRNVFTKVERNHVVLMEGLASEEVLNESYRVIQLLENVSKHHPCPTCGNDLREVYRFVKGITEGMRITDAGKAAIEEYKASVTVKEKKDI